MKLWETFRYELVYQTRSVTTWFYFILLLALSFLMAAIFIDESLAEGYYSNAPYFIAKISLISFFFLGSLILAQFSGNAAARDIESRMYPLLYSCPIPRRVYLGGRFLAAFALGSIIMLAIPIGVFAAGVFPLEHPEKLGPFKPEAYVSTYFIQLLPNTLFLVAFMFSGSVLCRKGMVSYLVAVIMGVLVMGSWQFIGSQQENWDLANLLDPYGISFIQYLELLWTADQKNTLLPGLEPTSLLNRVIWVCLSAGVLLMMYWKFNTSTISRGGKEAEKRSRLAEDAIGSHRIFPTEVFNIPWVSQRFGPSTRLLQFWIMTKGSFKFIAFPWGWLALVLMCLFVVGTGPMWFSDHYDIPQIPVTGNLLATLGNVMDHGIWLIIPLLIIYYAGELVWFERDSRMDDMVGAAPLPTWISFYGKFAGMLLALIVLQFCLMIAGIIVQISLGHYNFEIPVYLKILFGLRLADHVLLAVLAFALHVILNQKYLAYLIAVLFYLLPVLGPEFGIHSGLALYGSDPGWSYSDLRGLDPFMGPWAYFKLYWLGWALLLIAISILLWPRGTERTLSRRFKLDFGKHNDRIKTLALVSVLMILITGGIIHYSTHYLYPATATDGTLEWKAEYEKWYGKYRNHPQPFPTQVKLQVEIYPERGSAEFRGTYLLKNQTASTIDTLFVSTAPGVEHHTLSLSLPVRSQYVDDELDIRMYVLEKPLSPEDSLQVAFHVNYHPKGFPHHGMRTAVVPNGTYFDNGWLPLIGYDNSRQVFNANDRIEQGLPPRSFLETDEVEYGQQRVQFEAVIGTDKGQTAVAPGKLVKSWTQNDRSYFQYTTEAPINGKFSFFTSNYHEYKGQWSSDSGHVVDISILHHPQHTHNLDRMIQGVQASFNYLTRECGDYRHSEIRFAEVPGYDLGLRAFPTNVLYREGFALLKPEGDHSGVDIVFATVAHEVAHQWWGHQVSPAPIKGAALITESLAWYAAFEIVEQALGEEMLLKLLDLARDDYFRPHQRSADPLLQASQTNLIYRKGPLALYALREYIGKEQLRRGLKNFFEDHSKLDSDRPVPSDLYKALQEVTPDSLQYLLHDLFATNTFWQLRTEKVVATEIKPGKWRVALNVVARKYTVDQMGVETDVEMNDWVQIGIFRKNKGDQFPKALYLRSHRINSGKQTIEIELTQKPKTAGIDPNNLLMDLKRWDNLVDVNSE